MSENEVKDESKKDRRTKKDNPILLARLVRDGERVRNTDGFILGFIFKKFCRLCGPVGKQEHTHRLFTNPSTNKNYQVTVCHKCGTLSEIKEVQ